MLFARIVSCLHDNTQVGIAHGEDALVEVATTREESGDLVGAARWYTAASWMFGRGGMTAARSTDLLYHSCDLMMRHDPKPNTREAEFEIKIAEIVSMLDFGTERYKRVQGRLAEVSQGRPMAMQSEGGSPDASPSLTDSHDQ